MCILDKMGLCVINRNTIDSTKTCLEKCVQSFPMKLIEFLAAGVNFCGLVVYFCVTAQVLRTTG